jgi:hypothetical protein
MELGKMKEKHNYQKAIDWLTENGKIPVEVGLHMMEIRHDKWCEGHVGLRCNCQPDVVINGKRAKYPITILG